MIIVHISVPVIIHAFHSVEFSFIPPHIVNQIRMVRIHQLVHNSDNDSRFSPLYFPCALCIDTTDDACSKIPLFREKRIRGKSICPARLMFDKSHGIRLVGQSQFNLRLYLTNALYAVKRLHHTRQLPFCVDRHLIPKMQTGAPMTFRIFFHMWKHGSHG